jgi:integrase
MFRGSSCKPGTGDGVLFQLNTSFTINLRAKLLSSRPCHIQKRLQEYLWELSSGLPAGSIAVWASRRISQRQVRYFPQKARSYNTFEKHHIKTILAYFKDYDLSEISPLLVEKFKRELLNKPVIGNKPRKPASVNRLLAVLSGTMRMACDNGLITRNPCSKVKRLREDNARTRFLTVEEEEVLIEGLKGQYVRLKPMVLIALNTGMRLGEIVNLTWNQIEWERNRINVISTKNAVDRTIPLDQGIKDLLIQLWRNCDKTKQRVFPNEKASAIGLSFSLLVKRVKLIDFHFHDLRHTFATRLAESGVDAFTIAALLGHKTLAMTQWYTHPIDDHKRKAIEVLGKYEKIRHKSGTIEFSRKTNKAV